VIRCRSALPGRVDSEGLPLFSGTQAVGNNGIGPVRGLCPPAAPGCNSAWKNTTMDDDQLRSYFSQQAKVIIKESSHDQDGFVTYFTSHEPRDEEILCLLAVSTVAGTPDPCEYPTPLEALAALSTSSRSEICRMFRAEIRNGSRQASAA